MYTFVFSKHLFYLLFVYFFFAGQCICASGCFVRMENINSHPVLTIMFEKILGTSEAEILKISKNIQPRPKN